MAILGLHFVYLCVHLFLEGHQACRIKARYKDLFLTRRALYGPCLRTGSHSEVLGVGRSSAHSSTPSGVPHNTFPFDRNDQQEEPISYTEIASEPCSSLI